MKDAETYYQRAWHGSGMDFNLGKPLTGAGDVIHGRVILPKIKRQPGSIKKHAKSKELPSYLYEVVISLH